MICLLVIRSIVRGVTSTSAESAENAEQAKPLAAESDDEYSSAEQSDVPATHWKRDFRSDGVSLREELSEYVEEDPEAAANILRNWI